MSDLTDRQRRVLTMLVEGVEQQRRVTFRGIAEEFGNGSPSLTSGYLKALEKKGYIAREPDQDRPGVQQHRVIRILKLPDGTPIRGFRAVREAEP